MSSSTTSAAQQPVSTDAAPGAGRPGMTLAVIVSFMALVGIDSTIVNMALPHVQTELSFSTADLSWVLNAYTLTFGGLLLLGGRLGDVLGRRKVFVAGIVVFTVASLIGGFAQADWWLLAGRAGQGVGAALAAPSTMALIATNFEGPARAKAIAVYSAVMGAGASVGLIVGGALTDLVSWRWVLFVNVPLGAVIALLAPRFIKQPDTHPGRFDILGALTSTLGMGSLVYAFIRVASDGWGDRQALVAFGAAVVLMIAFFLVEVKATQPITPLHLFANAARSSAFASTLFLTAAMFSVLFLLTQFQQGVLGFTPLQAGCAFLPMTIAQFGSVKLVPKLLPKLGAKPLLLTGATLVTGGIAWLTQLTPDANYFASIAVPLLLIGTGVGIAFPTLNMTVLSGVQPQESGAASGVLQALQWLGGTLGLSIFVTVLGTATRSAQANPVGATALEQANNATTHGITTAYIAAAVSGALALLIALLTRKPKPAEKKD